MRSYHCTAAAIKWGVLEPARQQIFDAVNCPGPIVHYRRNSSRLSHRSFVELRVLRNGIE